MKQWMLIGTSFFFFSLANFALAAAEVEVMPEVTFSKTTLYSGDTVRVYATLRNNGDVDISGDVTFYMGSIAAGKSREVSLRSGGFKEDVFQDIIVPDGTFNIRVEIANTDPPDTNKLNNVVLTGLVTPVHDKDRDGKVDESDNCPLDANTNQANMDGDAQGDTCDGDIDGDGLSNEAEAAAGTDPRDVDTDDDGKNDSVDPTPLGEPLKLPAPPAPVVQPKPTMVTPTTSATTTTPTPSADSGVQGLRPSSPASEQPSVTSPTEGISAIPLTPLTTSTPSISSPRSIFSFEEIRWSTFGFHVVGPTDDVGYGYAWDFGDGTTSARRDVTHTFGQAGDFRVAVRVTDPDGVEQEDTVDMHIPFFSMDNSSVRMLVIFLGMLFIAGLVVFYRLGGKQSRT